MKSDFDVAAQTYDQDFTNSAIGKAQRDQVWKYLNRHLDENNHIRVLELNCGTGEDASRFARKGYKVVATDISESMLHYAQQKSTESHITFHKLDFNDIEQFYNDEKFDLVFSNFGGLNCVDSSVINRVCNKVSSILNQNGKFVAVIMPEYCLWESSYFLLKGRWKEAFRRSREYAIANVADEQVKTYYFSPAKFERLSPAKLKRELLKPIGLFVPPSYLENFIIKRPALLKFCNKLDELLARFSWQAYISDHYYIQFSIK